MGVCMSSLGHRPGHEAGDAGAQECKGEDEANVAKEVLLQEVSGRGGGKGIGEGRSVLEERFAWAACLFQVVARKEDNGREEHVEEDLWVKDSLHPGGRGK